ncbi:redoxin domain-containing protein [Acidobacteria bacterium AH-259-L09]|nr:redoxin domain-containing protein [Acidobacteria bacterium AH-259-L09]
MERKLFAATVMLMLTCLSYGEDWRPREGANLIGRRAPEFEGLHWLNSEPLRLKDLRGKVVLIQFWLMECPFCANTAPALNELYEDYASEGLVVIGVHHPKSEFARDAERIRRAARRLGFQFPVAHDNEWKTINTYWTGVRRSFTSSSFLIDKSGTIRWVHHGGEYYRQGRNPCEIEAFHSLERAIKQLLAE